MYSSTVSDRLLDRDLPASPFRVAASPAQLTPDFHHVIADPVSLEQRSHLIDGESLGDTRQVALHIAPFLAHRPGRRVQLQQPIPDTLPGRLQLLVGGQGHAERIPPESVQVHDGPHGRVERPPRLLADSHRLLENVEGLLRHRSPDPGPGPRIPVRPRCSPMADAFFLNRTPSTSGDGSSTADGPAPHPLCPSSRSPDTGPRSPHSTPLTA
jgi:hypothetical protein